MSLSSSFDLLSFQRKVQDALRSVERTLELERRPRLAADVDHAYGAKYGLANSTSNAAIIAYVNCLEKLGLDAAALRAVDRAKAATLRFESSTSCEFSREVTVDVPASRSYEETEETKGGVLGPVTKTKTMKAVSHIKEFHWEAESSWSISVYSGTAVEDKKVIKSRTCKTALITQSHDSPLAKFSNAPIDVSLTWLLKQIDTSDLTSQFKVDLEDDETKTPRRNDAVRKAIDFASELARWCQNIQRSFMYGNLQLITQRHNPALPEPQTFTVGQLMEVRKQYSIFNPILPLMEEGGRPRGEDGGADALELSTVGLRPSASADGDDGEESNEVLLSSADMSNLLNEHVCTLEGALGGIEKAWPSGEGGGGSVLSSSEAALSLLLAHLIELCAQYAETMDYVESMMENQLIAAIGKRLTPRDLDKFVKYHDARLLAPAPRPFSHAIRRPGHYPVGLLSIESIDGENECIHSHSREVNATSSLTVPLNAATVLELTGQQYLHGYMNHRFGTSSKNHQIVARARQFSSFILVIGSMTSGCLEPKDAIIIQNKDDVIIPLLLEEMPTAKEFKDAIKSLSPEQQRFARAYRKMQLASSVFGVCVVQIKPQLETLLGLPADALDKEMKLTQDLMELFVEYQVPSDMLSYNGFGEHVSVEDKISNVRDNVKSVVDVINAEKDKQLKAEQAKTDMALEQKLQRSAALPEGWVETADPSSGRNYYYHEASGDTSWDRPKTEKSWQARVRGDAFMIADVCAMASCAPPPPAGHPAPSPFGSSATAPVNSFFGAPAPSPSVSSAKMRYAWSPPEMAVAESAPAEMSVAESTTVSADASAVSKERASRNIATPGETAQLSSSSDKGVDFTLIPQILDAAVEKNGEGVALRSTTIKAGDNWTRNRQENLLSQPKKQTLTSSDIKKEKNKAFDLLDALSRSGSLPISYSELHVIVAVTHCFDRDVMSTVVCDNVNPIEKLERSTLLLASAVHGVPARDLIADVGELQRLEGSMPLLLCAAENDEGA